MIFPSQLLSSKRSSTTPNLTSVFSGAPVGFALLHRYLLSQSYIVQCSSWKGRMVGCTSRKTIPRVRNSGRSRFISSPTKCRVELASDVIGYGFLDRNVLKRGKNQEPASSDKKASCNDDHVRMDARHRFHYKNEGSSQKLAMQTLPCNQPFIHFPASPEVRKSDQIIDLGHASLRHGFKKQWSCFPLGDIC